MMYLIVALLSLLFGLAAGCRLTWAWMERQWQRNPYSFRLLIDMVIDKRVKEGRLHPLEDEVL